MQVALTVLAVPEGNRIGGTLLVEVGMGGLELTVLAVVGSCDETCYIVSE